MGWILRKLKKIGKVSARNTGLRPRRKSNAELLSIIDSVMSGKGLYLQQSLNMESIAEAAGMNRTYVSQAISSSGRGFYEYVNDYRIRHALLLLTSSSDRGMTLSEAAVDSGFRDCRQMNKYVREIYGMTASAYFSIARVSH
jgi:AraC-like DNA-binding protein